MDSVATITNKAPSHVARLLCLGFLSIMKKLTFEKLAALEDMTRITRVANGYESSLIKLCTVPHDFRDEQVVYLTRRVGEDAVCVKNENPFDQCCYFVGEIGYKELAKIMIAQIEREKNWRIEAIKNTYKIKL